MILHVLANPDFVAEASLRDGEQVLINIEMRAEKFIVALRRVELTTHQISIYTESSNQTKCQRSDLHFEGVIYS
jgi:hypothetical protein